MTSPSTPLRGKTYSLYGKEQDTERYYSLIRRTTDRLLDRCPDKQRLLEQLRKASQGRSLLKTLSPRRDDRQLLSFIKNTLRESFTVYTTGVRQHLKTLPISLRFDPVLRTKEEQYHLYMVEIELTNRIYRSAFRHCDYRFALIAHCLRDFRPACRAERGEYESLCRGCTTECLVHLGSVLLKKYDIHPFISVTMNLDKLFRRIKAKEKSVGALGVACVPELVMGMRLCIEMDIPAVGIPLDANRCTRWMNRARETSFSLHELERLLA